MLNRSEARKVCMTCLYQIDILRQNKLPINVDEILKENLEIENDFVSEIVNGVTDHLDEIDKLCNSYLTNWKINRLDKAGANILRMAFYELKYMDTPAIVVINEAVELAKTYTDKELADMINASLDKFVKES